jgi:His/Glu/Gln/Arg/opine family amino acid ABC transporter permease subunit
VIEIMGPLLEGTGVTLQVFLLTFVLAVPLGLGLALIRISGFGVLGGLVNGYIWLMRGTPLMLQMLFIYFALPFVPVIGVRLPDFRRRSSPSSSTMPRTSPRSSAPASSRSIAVSTKARACLA